MLLLKYFENFNDDGENKLSKKVYDLQNDNEFNANKYVESEGCYRFAYYDYENSQFTLKIFPQWDLFYISYSDKGFSYCAFSAIEKNKDFFQTESGDEDLWHWITNTINLFQSEEIPSITFKNTKLLMSKSN